ncbi:hypothetical protein BH23CHL8_BH23CHL8_24740 [soil metagenome]
MELLSILLVGVGIGAIAVGVAMVRAPRAILRRLDDAESNLRRYDAWRGGRRGLDDDGPTGADVMREHMRRRLYLWAGVIAVGAVLTLAGLIQG